MVFNEFHYHEPFIKLGSFKWNFNVFSISKIPRNQKQHFNDHLINFFVGRCGGFMVSWLGVLFTMFMCAANAEEMKFLWLFMISLGFGKLIGFKWGTWLANFGLEWTFSAKIHSFMWKTLEYHNLLLCDKKSPFYSKSWLRKNFPNSKNSWKTQKVETIFMFAHQTWMEIYENHFGWKIELNYIQSREKKSKKQD